MLSDPCPTAVRNVVWAPVGGGGDTCMPSMTPHGIYTEIFSATTVWTGSPPPQVFRLDGGLGLWPLPPIAPLVTQLGICAASA